MDWAVPRPPLDHKVVLLSTTRLIFTSGIMFLLALVMELFLSVDLKAYITRRNPSTFFYTFQAILNYTLRNCRRNIPREDDQVL